MWKSQVVGIRPWLHPEVAVALELAWVVVASITAIAAAGDAMSVPPAAAMWTQAPIVVAELFTSEACSSCPPADAVLDPLTRMPSLGVVILPLAEHVDYWNDLGWHDRFSSAEFSVRQSTYDVDAFQRDPYTPPLVIDGRFQHAGTDLAGIQRAIQQAAQSPKALVEVTVGPGQASRRDLDIHVEVPDAVMLVQPVDAIVAVTEGHLTTDVRGGENRGRTLRHESVVRQMRAVVQLPPDRRTWQTRTRLVLAPDWQPANLRVVCFLQERATRRIVGAGAVSVGR
jgi:hypothetical protein